MTSSRFRSFISVYLSWVRRGNAGVYKATDDFVYDTLVGLFRSFKYRCRLHVVYTLTSAKNSRDRVVPSR